MPNLAKKIVAIVTTITCAVWTMGPGVVSVNAATVEELQAQIADLLAQLEALQAQLAKLQAAPAAPAIKGIPADFTFEPGLAQGMSGVAVKYLQIVLNSDPDTQLAATGPGSPGNETTYFGPLTKAAVIKFQEKYADEVLAKWGLTKGTGYVGRTTAAKLNSLLAAAPPKEAPPKEVPPKEAPPKEEVPTAATVSLAVDTPAAGAVAKGAQDVVFTKIKFTAGSEPYTISAIKVKRTGISVDTDISNVKLFDGTTQLGSAQGLSLTYATFRDLAWEIPANTAKTLTIKASIAASPGVGNNIAFGIEALADISAPVTLAGTFPIYGNSKVVATVAAGSLAVSVSGPGGNVPIGATEQVFANITLTPSATENVVLNSITVKRSGTTSDGDLANIKLFDGATQVGATVVALANSRATFDNLNLTLTGAKTLTLRADVVVGTPADRTVIFGIDNKYDVTATGVSSGGMVNITGTFPANASSVTTKTGTLSIGSDPLNPSAASYVVNRQDVKMLAFKLITGTTEGTKISSIKITLSTGDDSDLSGVTLYDVIDTTETKIAGPSSVIGGAVTFYLSPPYEIPANTNRTILVKANVAPAASGNFALSLATTTDVVAKGLSSNVDITVGGSAQTGGTMTAVANGTLTISANPGKPGAADVAPNTNDFLFNKIDLTASSAEDLRVTSITITESGSIDDDEMGGIDLWVDGTQFGSTTNLSSNKATFSGSLLIPAGTTKTVLVKGDVLSTADANDTIILSVAAKADVVVSGVSSGITIPEASKDGSATGSTMTVKTGTLTVSMGATPPTDTTYVIGTSQASLATLQLTAGEAEDLRVTRIKVSMTTAASSEYTTIGNIRLYDGATAIGDVKASLTPVVLQIDSADAAWTAATNVTASADTTDKKEGTASAKLVIADAFTTGLVAYKTITSKNLSSASTVDLWIKASAAISADVLQLVLDDSNDCSSPVETINLPAITTDWAKKTLTLANPASDTAIVCVGIKASSDPGAVTVWVDDVTTLSQAYADFTGLVIDITKGTTKQIGIKADIKTAKQVAKYKMGIWAKTDITTTGKASGKSVTDDTTTFPVQGNTIINSSVGTLTITRASDTPLPSQVVAGSSDVALLKLKLSATNESIKVSKIVFDRIAGADADFKLMKLYDGATLLAEAPVVSSAVTFSNLTVTVTKDVPKYLTLKADLNTKAEGATSGNIARWKLAANPIGANKLVAQGVSSGTVLSAEPNTADINSKAQRIYVTKLTAALNTGSPSGTQVKSTTATIFKIDLTAGPSDVIFTDAADKGKIVINLGASAAIIGKNYTAGCPTYYLKDGTVTVASQAGVDDANCNADAASQVSSAVLTFDTSDLVTDYVVPAGTTKTLSLVVDTTAAIVGAGNLVATVDTGSCDDAGTITSGGVWWSDGITDPIKWVDSPSITSGTMTF